MCVLLDRVHTEPYVLSLPDARSTAQRGNHRVPKACHQVIIKRHEISHLGFSGQIPTLALIKKSRILDKIEKLWTKMSCGSA